MEDFSRCYCVQSDKCTRRSIVIAAATVGSRHILLTAISGVSSSIFMQLAGSPADCL